MGRGTWIYLQRPSSQPGKLIEMFYNTLVWQLQYYHLTMFGAYLGNIDQVLDVPYFIILFLTFALVVMALKKPGDETIYIKGWKRAWIWFLFLACAGATMFSMLVPGLPQLQGDFRRSGKVFSASSAYISSHI